MKRAESWSDRLRESLRRSPPSRYDADPSADSMLALTRALEPRVRFAAHDLDALCEFCESPLEAAMLRALVAANAYAIGIPGGFAVRWPGKGALWVPGRGLEENGLRSEPLVELRIQEPVAAYRADFLLIGRCDAITVSSSLGEIEIRAVIECDGYEFHERTKEQAARDRGRDRELQLAGYKVLRYTGAQVWRDPFACALEAFRAAFLGAIDASVDLFIRSAAAEEEGEP